MVHPAAAEGVAARAFRLVFLLFVAPRAAMAGGQAVIGVEKADPTVALGRLMGVAFGTALKRAGMVAVGTEGAAGLVRLVVERHGLDAGIPG